MAREVELREGAQPCRLVVSPQIDLALGGIVAGERTGQVAERLMATDCKSVAPCELRRFESSPVHHSFFVNQAVVAQLVERVLGKDEVTSSILVNSSRFLIE